MKVTVLYYAMLREDAGCREEVVERSGGTAADLYADCAARHGFALPRERLKVAVNHEMVGWDTPLADGQTIAFVPPVAGGCACSA